MTRILYELTGSENRRFSPYCWRTRMALAHKGLACQYEPCGFTQKDKIAFSGHQSYPVLVDGDAVATDSWDIACYLDDNYRDAPSLFNDGGDGGGRAMAYFINSWTDTQLHPAILRTIIFDVYKHLLPEDTDYFRTNREARFKCTLEEMAAEQDARGGELPRIFAPLRNLLTRQDWIGGAAPAYGDYIVFGALQWARCVSPYPIVPPGDPVHEWRGRMIALHDGLADTVPHYDY
ncbi:MAG: Beta-etherase [Alphaproteobacteria bacterium MarineAlpha10_Bin3]|jgi:glutathione S-transferase|nr:MAG: Beta-etherase [Alphaproteobacteria bacterium MarineAlpha10_Bin3]PPR75062.1 MAG: Beta-etherase [Alphaproteobacteria bacterium MarineAlpha4_Bin1]